MAGHTPHIKKLVFHCNGVVEFSTFLQFKSLRTLNLHNYRDISPHHLDELTLLESPSLHTRMIRDSPDVSHQMLRSLHISTTY